MDRLYESIMWFDSKQSALKFFNEHDWEGDYSYNTDEQNKFITEAKAILMAKD